MRSETAVSVLQTLLLEFANLEGSMPLSNTAMLLSSQQGSLRHLTLELGSDFESTNGLACLVSLSKLEVGLGYVSGANVRGRKQFITLNLYLGRLRRLKG